MSMKEIGLFYTIVSVTALIISISILINLAIAGEYLMEEGGCLPTNESNKAELNTSFFKKESDGSVGRSYQGYIISLVVVVVAVVIIFYDIF
jgi:hypothetical protein